MVELSLTPSADLVDRLSRCPAGILGWHEFEDVALSTMQFLFVPPLTEPFVQARTFSGIDRRDAIFPNRVTDPSKPWGLLRQDLDARLIPVEFKNYDRSEIGKQEVDQTRNYMKQDLGRLAFICSNKSPGQAAYLRRNMVFSEE